MADIVIRLFSKYSDYKHLYLWEEDERTLTVHDPNTGKQIGVAFPLPEGHGRLVDADAFHSPEDLNNAPTILEAEGGGEDG